MTEPTTGTRLRDPLFEGARLDGGAGPAARIDAARADALVAGAVDTWLAGAPTAPGGVEPAPSVGAAGAGLGRRLAVGGGALAVMGVVAYLTGGPAATPAPTPGPARDATPAGTAALPADAPPLAPPPAPAAAPEVSEAAEAAAPRDPAPAPAAAPAPADLLERANALRAEGRYRAAGRLYDRAARGAGASMTGYVARVAAASLRLQHLGDARGAVSRYRGALAASPAGPLDLEIRRGLAQAYRALGDDRAEAAALEALLAGHPRGPAAEEARTRLAALRRGGEADGSREAPNPDAR